MTIILSVYAIVLMAALVQECANNTSNVAGL